MSTRIGWMCTKGAACRRLPEGRRSLCTRRSCRGSGQPAFRTATACCGRSQGMCSRSRSRCSWRCWPRRCPSQSRGLAHMSGWRTPAATCQHGRRSCSRYSPARRSCWPTRRSYSPACRRRWTLCCRKAVGWVAGPGVCGGGRCVAGSGEPEHSPPLAVGCTGHMSSTTLTLCPSALKAPLLASVGK